MKADLTTKQGCQDLVRQILAPVRPFFTQAGAILGGSGACYGPDTAAMEAFLRPLWGLVPYWAGGGPNTGFEALYPKGLAAGTDPDDKEYWGGFWDGDQRFVEMGAIAFGLLLTPEMLWEPLTNAQKERLVQWLSAINHHRLPESNWLFFRVIVNVALKKRGCAYDPACLQADLNKLETFYQGDGWYCDGDSGRRDYYVSFALHYFSLLYIRFMDEEDPARCAQWKARAMRFAEDFIYWFDEQGAALAYGRSMTYRFVQTAFFSACALANVWPFPIGVIKGIILRNLDWWMRQPIFDRAGLLTIGYGYPNLCMAEIYNAPGSPYWGMKAFTFLALPDDHPFWAAQPPPLPPLQKQRLLKQGGMLLRRYPGHTTAYLPGAPCGNDLGHFADKYEKFAYDTAFGFSVSHGENTLSAAAPDSMLAFVIDDRVYMRRFSHRFTLTSQDITAEWSPFPGISVTTRIIPTETGHMREHVISSNLCCIAFDCGFSVPSDGPGAGYTQTAATACVQTDQCSCEICSLEGGGMPVILGTDPNTHLMHTRTRLPAVRYSIHAGISRLCTQVIAKISHSQERKPL